MAKIGDLLFSAPEKQRIWRKIATVDNTAFCQFAKFWYIHKVEIVKMVVSRNGSFGVSDIVIYKITYHIKIIQSDYVDSPKFI